MNTNLFEESLVRKQSTRPRKPPTWLQENQKVQIISSKWLLKWIITSRGNFRGLGINATAEHKDQSPQSVPGTDVVRLLHTYHILAALPSGLSWRLSTHFPKDQCKHYSIDLSLENTACNMFSVEHSSAGSILALNFPLFVSTSLERNTDRTFANTMAARIHRCQQLAPSCSQRYIRTTKWEAEWNMGSL